MGVHWYEILERKVQADGSKRGAADLLKLVTFDVKSGVGGMRFHVPSFLSHIGCCVQSTLRCPLMAFGLSFPPLWEPLSGILAKRESTFRPADPSPLHCHVCC